MAGLFMLLAIIGFVSAAPRDVNRIVGGEAVDIRQYPYMANMQYSLWGTTHRAWCGGTVITTRSVVSAAHCFFGDSPSQWRVRLGSSLASSGGVQHDVSRLIIHENYSNRMLLNDIAIARLSSNAVLSDSVGLARVAGPQYVVNDNARVYAAGWGTIRSFGPASEALLHVGVDVINHALCTERYAYLKTQPNFAGWPDVTPEMLCTGILDVGGKDACQGDSGGPVIHQGDVLVGITSWGFQCAHAFYPGVNVRVSSYTNWITSNA